MHFLLIIPGNYILLDQTVVAADVVHGSRANYLSDLPVTEKAAAVREKICDLFFFYRNNYLSLMFLVHDNKSENILQIK